MNISGAVVYALPGRAASLRESLARLPGVEIHAEAEGRFIVTVEDAPGAQVADTVMALHGMDGVLFAAMVYQYGDDARSAERTK